MSSPYPSVSSSTRWTGSGPISRRTLEDLQKSFSDKSIVPIQMPIGQEESFKGVIDLIAMKAYIYKDDQSGAFELVGHPRGSGGRRRPSSGRN